MHLKNKNISIFFVSSRRNIINILFFTKQIMTSKTKITAFFLGSLALCLSLTGCLGGSESETVVNNLQNATVKSFTVEDNSDVCPNLSKYAFTIDNFGTSDPELASKMSGAGIIFNADSLPVGSVPDSIHIKLDYSSPSSVYFHQYDDAGVLKNSVNFTDTQTISFEDFAVTRLDIVSTDGNAKKSYFIKINIHTTYGDTIRWQYRAKDLCDMTKITDQTSESIGSEIFWFKEYNGSSVKVSKSTFSSISKWSAEEEVSGEEQPVLSTLFAWNNAFYAAGKEGALLTSTDGKNWTAVSKIAKFVSILGIQYASKKYEGHLHAVVNDEGTYKFARTFNGIDWELGDVCPANFPIKSFSRPISDKAKPEAGNVTSRVYIVGGETADGTIVSSTWSCDGNSWAEFPQSFLPAMTRASIIEYTLDSDHPKSFWILWPGVLADGSVRNTAYFSENKGVTWKLLSREFPSYSKTSPIAPVGAVSGFVDPDTYWMNFIGGVDADGKHQANIFGGLLPKLAFDKVR